MDLKAKRGWKNRKGVAAFSRWECERMHAGGDGRDAFLFCVALLANKADSLTSVQFSK